MYNKSQISTQLSFLLNSDGGDEFELFQQKVSGVVLYIQARFFHAFSKETKIKSYLFNLVLVFTGVFLPFSSGIASSAVFYVDDTAAGANDGSSWTDAYTDLQNALTAADPNDQIWIAAGTYYPSVQIGGTGPRYAAFQMKNGVAIYGGYAGTETDPNQRDIQNNQTILSGDIGAAGNISDNCYHIFYHPAGLNLNTSAILDGFTITAANANGPTSTSHRDGAGMYNDAGSPTVRNCTFSANVAYWDGGGIYNNNCSPTITGCTFSNNLAYWGGGMVNYSSNPAITNCIFIANTGESRGGGMYSDNSSPNVMNCAFSANISPYGGGLVNYESNSTITNCIFAANRSTSYGGGIWNNYCSPAITNCTFVGNWARLSGGGIRNYYLSNPRISNCILWGNTAAQGPQIYNHQSTPMVTFCNVEGGWTGDGNLDSDPLFTDPNGPDGTLGTADDDLRLSYLSPCRDKGSDPNLPADILDLDCDSDTTESIPYDLYNHSRVVDGDCSGTATVDMGAAEFNPKQTGDLDSNCQIDMQDFSIFAQAWQTTPQDAAWNPDCNLSFPADGIIELADFSILSDRWLTEIPLVP